MKTRAEQGIGVFRDSPVERGPGGGGGAEGGPGKGEKDDKKEAMKRDGKKRNVRSLVVKEQFPRHPIETSPLKTDKEIAHLDPA